MNNNFDRQVTGDHAVDDRIRPRFRQQKAFTIRGAGAARRISLALRRESSRSFTRSDKDDPSGGSSRSDLKTDWTCLVCSFHNDDAMTSDDRCSRCRFLREKSDEDKFSTIGSSPSTPQARKTPGAYVVSEKGRTEHQLRPIQRDVMYSRKMETQSRKGGNGEINITPSDLTGKPKASRPHKVEHVEASSSSQILESAKAITPTTGLSPLARHQRSASLASSDLQRPSRVKRASTTSRMPSEASRSSSDYSLHQSLGDLNVADEKMWASCEGWIDQEEGPWECSMCTYMNDNAIHLTCAVCGHRRDSKASVTEGNAHIERFSITTGQARLMEETLDSLELRDAEEIKRHRTNELIMMQYELMAELKTGQTGQTYDEEPVRDLLESSKNPSVISTSTEKQSSLKEITKQLSELSFLHDEERKQSQLMLELQESRKESIMQDEGPDSLSGQRPGLTKCPNNISRQALEWLGQQRMLNDWQDELELREKRIDELRRQQQQILEQIQKEASGKSSSR